MHEFIDACVRLPSISATYSAYKIYKLYNDVQYLWNNG